MRNKWLMSLFIVILALPFFNSATFAEETQQFADGKYDINYTVKHATEDKTSAADNFFTKPAQLIVENGKQTIQLQLTGSEMIKSLKVAGVEVTVISEDSDTKVVSFAAAGDLSEAVKMEIHVEVPGMYDTTHIARAFFDVSGVPVKEEVVEEVQPEEPAESEEPVEEPTEEEPEEEPAKPETPVENTNPLVPDEAYTLNFVSESPSVQRQFLNPVALLYKDGEAYIQIDGTSGQFIESLTINGKEVTWGKKNEDGTFTVQFKVDDTSLSTVLDFGMDINAGGREMSHLVDLAFDESTKVEADVADFTLLTDNNKPEEPSEKPDQEDSKKPEDQEGAVDKGENKEETPVKNPLAPDKAFEINFEFKHETEDKTSAADNFFVKPAILLEKDGERYLQITVTGSEYIDAMKNKFGDFIVVRKNADGSVVYQFKLDGKITDAMLVDMVISVPGVYENQAHKARLFLDESSMKEIDASKYLLAAAQNGNGPTGDGKSGNDFIPAKPELNDSKKDNVKNQVKNSGKVTNPQTGDTTNIMLLVLLLIGSAIPLAVQLKRRIA